MDWLDDLADAVTNNLIACNPAATDPGVFVDEVAVDIDVVMDAVRTVLADKPTLKIEAAEFDDIAYDVQSVLLTNGVGQVFKRFGWTLSPAHVEDLFHPVDVNTPYAPMPKSHVDARAFLAKWCPEALDELASSKEPAKKKMKKATQQHCASCTCPCYKA